MGKEVSKKRKLEKKEELSLGEELASSSSDSPSSSSSYDDDDDSENESEEVEDEEGELVTPAIEAQILRTLAEIRSKDSKIYDPNAKFFDEEELEAAEAEWIAKQKAKGKKVTLTDYQRERILSGRYTKGEEDSGDDDQPPVLTHAEEQEALRREFKMAYAAAEDEDDEEGEGEGEDEDGLFRIKPKSSEQKQKEEEDYKSFLLENLSKSANARESMGDWLSYKEDQHGKGVADPEEKFLIDYVLGRGWIDQQQPGKNYEQIIAEDEEDLEAVERAEEYETALNFRFEQPGADQIVTYARTVEGSMRREDSRRKRQREAKAARKELEAKQREEELKRKKNEVKRLAKKLSKQAGLVNVDTKLVEELVAVDEEDFDLTEHDRKMAQLFNDAYYEADDDQMKPEADDLEDGDLEEDDDCPMNIVSAASKNNKVVEEALDKLDYEDVIGDGLQTRFKYIPVIPSTFGLKPGEILEADETLLNEHVSLSKLAPYRPTEVQQKDIRRYGDKRRVYMLRKKMWETTAAKRNDKRKANPKRKDNGE